MVVFRERVHRLVPVTEMLALLAAVTKAKDESEDECLW